MKKAWKIRKATPEDRQSIQELHVKNHLKETAYYPGELEFQNGDLEEDFPQLYSKNEFCKCIFFVSVIEEEKNQPQKVIGSIGLKPDEEEKETVWLNSFSVSEKYRRMGIGSALMITILDEVKSKKFEIVKLITLDNHSKGRPIMKQARKMYEKFGFQKKKVENHKFGLETNLDVVWMEKAMKTVSRKT